MTDIGSQERMMSLKRKREVEEEFSDEEPTVFPCHKCSATFVTQISLARHSILHEDDPDQNDQDEEEYEDEGDLLLPIPEVVMNDDEQGESDSLIPDISSAPLAKLPKVRKTLKPLPNLKPLPPLIPKREFDLVQQIQDAQGLQLEMMPLKTHRCEMCSVYFGKKEDLNRHVTRTHGGARFTCPYCSRNISRRDHLKRHIKNVHPEICTDKEIGPFLADPNASRAAKEQHAENFVAQYGAPVTVAANSITPTTSPKNKSPGQKAANQIKPVKINTPGPGRPKKVRIVIQPEKIEEPQQQSLNDDDLYEEGDEEFEGEEESENVVPESQEQITIEPELPMAEEEYQEDQHQPSQPEYDQDEDSSGYLDQGQPMDLFDIQQLIVPNPAIQNDEEVGEGAETTPAVANGGGPERKFKCEMCEAAFMSNINLQRHISTHSIDRPHKCSLCGKGFLRKEHLTKHLSSVHSGMKFTCQFCGKDISRKDHLLRHIRNCHPQEYLLMPAEFIQSEMSQPIPRTEETGKRSVLGAQVSPKQPFITCDICPETFNHIDELHEHQSSVHSDVRKYKCPSCPKAFKRKEHLVKHEVLHSGEKNFACSICKKLFPRKDAVFDHIRRVHEDPPNDSYPCSLCEFAVFSHAEQLKQHLKTFHGASNDNADFHNAGLLGLDELGLNQNIVNYGPGATQAKRMSLPSNTKLSKLQARLTQQRPSLNNGGLGGLAGLINKGSLSLSVSRLN